MKTARPQRPAVRTVFQLQFPETPSGASVSRSHSRRSPLRLSARASWPVMTGGCADFSFFFFDMVSVSFHAAPNRTSIRPYTTLALTP